MGSLVEKLGWYEWLTHTNFSFLVGASHPHELVERACLQRYRGMAIADYDGVYGIARTFRALQTRLAAGQASPLHLSYGAELHLAQDHERPTVYQDTLVLIARTARGYTNLCRILSYAHRHGKDSAFVALSELLSMDLSDLVAIQPMRGLLRTHPKRWREHCTQIKDTLGSSAYFLSVARHLNPVEDQGLAFAVQTARDLDLSLLLCQDIFFHAPERKALSDVLHAIRLNQPIGMVGEYLFNNTHRCLQPLAHLERLYGVLPFYERALRTSRALHESIEFDLKELRYHYPREMIPENHTPQSFLERMVRRGAHERYGAVVPDKVLRLLAHELTLIETLGFADYFLTVWDIVAWARQQAILCQGRGSAANSAVCFVLGITSVDPARFELLFERFISVERGDPPDIDVDFEHERREEVIQYIYRRYGRERAAMVCNVICFKRKGALRAVTKALAATNPEEEKPHTLDLIAQMSQELRGFPRHLGIHSGGFMLSGDPLYHLVPIEPATMDGRTVVQWCKEDIEGLGFFKIDVLALGMLSAIRKCLALIATHYGRNLSLASIPEGDSQTYAMIQRADTVGVFQIESRAQISFLPKHRPRNFYDLVVQIAIIRPGPIEGGMVQSYLNRRLGREQVIIPDPRLEPILGRTYGVPIFQEQVMRTAIAVGDFTAGEADELRKNIGSFSLKGDVNRWVGKLQAGMRRNGISEAFIAGIMRQIKGFASYGFPESHAASFALIAYASCYLKCHYPAAFFTSLLNSQPMGFYTPDTLIKTARHLGVEVRPVCLQRSEWDTLLEDGSAMRLGLRMVYGLTEETAQRFITRRHGTLILVDILKQKFFSRRDLTALAVANAFAFLGLDRRAAIWLAEAAPFCPQLEEMDCETKVVFRAETELEAVQTDYLATATSLGRHPALLFKEEAWSYPVPLSRITLGANLNQLRSGALVTVFGLVLVRQAPPTAKNMRFLTLEDESSERPNLVVRPQIHARFGSVIDTQAFLCAQGKFERSDGAYSILVTHIFTPTVAQAEVIPLAFDRMDELSRDYM